MNTPKYFSNALWIQLPSWVPIVRRGATELDLEDDVANVFFFHEFIHHHINYSTIAGIKFFFLYQHLMAIFSHTFPGDRTWESAGSERLDDEQRKRLVGIFSYMQAFLGDRTRSGAGSSADSRLRVTGYSLKSKTFDWATGSAAEKPLVLDFAVDGPTGSVVIRDFTMGLTAIQESICFEIEQVLLERANPRPDVPPPPLLPYLVLRAFGEHIVQRDLDPVEVAGVGMLSLLTTASGDACEFLFQKLKEVGSTGRTPIQRIEALQPLVTANFLQAKTVVLKEDLKSVTEVNEGRGQVADAVEFLAKWAEQCLEARSRDMLHEFHTLSACSTAKQGVGNLVTQFPPVLILQEHIGDEGQCGRDHLISCVPGANTERYAYGFAALRSQFAFLFAHIDRNGFVTTNDAHCRCPLFTECKDLWRLKEQHVCAATPWRHLGKTDDFVCCYTSGVSSVISKWTASH